MLNNKGFAVSAVLYTLLVAFLLFLGVTLSMFQSSSNLVSNANKDIINGTTFEAMQVVDSSACASGYYTSKTIVRIKSRYGTMYWPKDFGGISYTGGIFSYTSGGSAKTYKNITVTINNNNYLKIEDTINHNTAKYIGINDDNGLKLYDTCN